IRGLREDGSFALLMAPRTGKTKTTIDTISIMHMEGEVNRCIVVCPTTVMDVWIREIRMHCPFRYRITLWDRDGRKSVKLPPLGQDILDFVIINYEAFSLPGNIKGKSESGITIRDKKGGRYALKKTLLAWDPQMIVLDESHRIKTPSA